MEKYWIIEITLAVFLTINPLFYKSLSGYVKSAFGKKRLNIWGNKVYFWQSSIFVSMSGTVLITYL